MFVKCIETAVALGNIWYIDDWFLAAKLPLQIQTHTRLLTSHLVALGFTVNWGKGVLISTQSITLGLSEDSVAFKARLPVERVKAFWACPALFCRGVMVKFIMCLRLLGLMASAVGYIAQTEPDTP